jgi:DNA ligase D
VDAVWVSCMTLLSRGSERGTECKGPSSETVPALASGSMADDATVVEPAGRQLSITHPDKVFFSERGETKLDLVRFYAAVEGPLLAAMGGRPVLLQRFPNGAGGSSFFQKRVPDSRPEWLQTTIVSTPNGTTSQALVAADLAHVLWAVNMACLGFHVWPTRADDPEHADELRIDLDPTPGVTFPMVQEAAHEVRALFTELGVVGLPKTTGNRGIHVYVRLQPRWTSYEVRAAAVAVARELERRRPDLITAAWWKEERGTRVFVDFNQNAPHKTIFGAWSVRARPGAQVSTPFGWDELDGIVPDELTIATVPERVARGGDPWAAMASHPQSLAPVLALHERDRAAGLPDAPWPPVYPKMPGEPPRVAPSRARKIPNQEEEIP